MTDEEGKQVLHEQERKKFDFQASRRNIEATSEYPVMYRALNSEPRTAHPFNVYRDIRTEPAAIEKTLEVTDEITSIIASEMVSRGIKTVINVGLPTSIFVGMVVASSLIHHAGLQSWHIDSTEFLLGDIPFDVDTTAFFFYSGSGSTHDTNAAAKIVQEKGGYSVAFTSIAGSPITGKCTRSIVCAGGMDTGGSDTFHYATRVAAGLLLSTKLARALHGSDPARAGEIDRFIEELKKVPGLMRQRIDGWDARCRSIAKRFWKKRAVLVVGGGPNIGSAEEMALKFDEMAHVPAKPMVPTRHLHGVFGLTDEQILTIIIAPPSPHEKWLRQVADVTTLLKSPAVALINDSETYIADQVDYVVRVPADDEYIYALLCVPVLQLLPYYFAVEDGTINPDCQRSDIPKHARAWAHVFPPGSH